MRREYIFVWHLVCFSLLLHFASFYTSAVEIGHEYSKGCAHLQCESGSWCIKRRFWCKHPPCPGMLYCSKTRTESLKGPATCDTVHCSNGYTCVVKVRGCLWDEKCKQQIARCVSEKEYHEGAASCAGFECPSGKHCILRESYCIKPPCKLLRSCAEAKDVQIWFDKCRTLDCPSEYECFLRKPDNNCTSSSCTHTPDCTLTAEDELINKHCRGWVCPQTQKCVVRIIGTCKGFDCAVERSCRGSLITSHSTTITSDKPTSATTLKGQQNTDYKTPQTHVSVIHQQITRKSSPITSSLGSPLNGYFTLPYPPAWLNYNKSSTTDDSNKTIGFTDWLGNSSSPTANRRIASTTAGDAKRLEVLKQIYIASDDALPLPVVLEGINFAGQGYPTWIKNEPHRSSAPLGARDEEDDGGRRYHPPQEPYRILLPPYEPVILVEDTRRGQFLPFLAYAFDHPFNAAALIPLPGITSRETTRYSKTNGISTTADNRIDNRVNGSEMENLKMNHFDDSGDYATNFPTIEKANQMPSNIPNKEPDNDSDDYEWRPWYMIRDYLERSKSQPVHEQDLESSVDESATLDLYANDTLANGGASARSQITDENGERIAETLYAQRRNKDLATFDPPRAPIATGQRDYSSRDEERHGLVNYPYDTLIVRDADKSRREHQGSPSDEISYVTPSGETQPGVSTTFSSDESNAPGKERPKVTMFLDVSSPRRNDDGDDRRNDEYDDYYSREDYDNISDV